VENSSVGGEPATGPPPSGIAYVSPFACRNALAIEAADAAFVSSNRWDVMGAAAFGFLPVWVNRSNMPDEYPDHPRPREVADLAALTSFAD